MKNFILSCFFTLLLFNVDAQNVGIGTLTPVSRLDVKSTNNNPVNINGTAGTYVSIMENDIYRGYFGSFSGNPEDMDFGTGGGSTGKLHLTIAASPRLTIDNAGNVGIGTTDPVAKLHLVSSSSSSINSALMIKNSVGDTLMRIRDNGYVGIGYNGPSYGRPLNIEGQGINLYYNQATFGGAVFPDINNNLVLWSNSSGPGMNVVLQPSWGQVTIGTYTPAVGYKLSIRGKAICEELKVQLNGSWPDYVFDSKYQLLPLDELEKKVMEQKHLPGIMPASVIELDNGFEVGDMQKRVVEKVEEMYRYMFEMNRENKALKAELGDLKARLLKFEPSVK